MKTYELSVPEKDLLQLQKNLFALKDFLERNPHLFHSSPTEPAASRESLADQEAWKVDIYPLIQGATRSHIILDREHLRVGTAKSSQPNH